MNKTFLCLTAFAVACLPLVHASAQEPPQPEAQLRFDQAEQEELADLGELVDGPDSTLSSRPFAFKLNRKRVDEAHAYDAVTLWNIRKVKAKNRCMRLSDSTGREKVRLLKFFIERDRKKGARPHLLGNVAGYTWNESVYDKRTEKWRRTRKHIAKYTLRDEYQAAREASGDVVLFKVPDELWRMLSPNAVYVLDGEQVPGRIFQFIDGLILRTLEIYTGEEAAIRQEGATELVIGDMYPDRIPLVVFNGSFTTIESWLKMCSSDAFAMNAAVPMHYFYMQPVEAVELYGIAGKYGAICIYMSE